MPTRVVGRICIACAIAACTRPATSNDVPAGGDGSAGEIMIRAGADANLARTAPAAARLVPRPPHPAPGPRRPARRPIEWRQPTPRRRPRPDGSAARPLVNVLTQKYDNLRTGWNSNLEVAGPVRMQPLVVSGLTVGNKVRNVVLVTASDTNDVYAFGADDAAAAATPLWTARFGTSAKPGILRACNGGATS